MTATLSILLNGISSAWAMLVSVFTLGHGIIPFAIMVSCIAVAVLCICWLARRRSLRQGANSNDPGLEYVEPAADQSKLVSAYVNFDSPTTDKRKGSIFGRLMRELRPYILSLTAISALLAMWIPLMLLNPVPMQILIDSVLVTHKPLPAWLTSLYPPLASMSVGSIVFLAIGLLLFTYISTSVNNLLTVWLSYKVGNRITLNMRARLFRTLQRLSIAYHDRRGTGDSNYSIQYDAPSVQAFAVNDFLLILQSIGIMVAMVAITFTINWELGSIAATMIPALLLVTMFYRKRLRLRWRSVKKTESAGMSIVQETLASMRLVKAFGREEHENERFYEQFSQSANASTRAYTAGGWFSLFVGIINAVSYAAVLYIGVGLIESGVLTVGYLYVVVSYLVQVNGPIKTLGKKVVDMEKSLAGMERFFAIVDREEEVPERPGALPISRAKGALSFEDVSFEYESGYQVLHKATFSIKHGTSLGIVGPTGSGKSTIANLMLRFFDPAEGRIMLDERDLKDYRLKDLRNQFAVVLQDTILFSTTVADNIRFARPDATTEEVIEAAKAAKAHDFISGLPDGYDTVVGEKGMLLSGGERQRISLARAFLKDAPILILDEPTSALDTGTEAEIMDTAAKLMKGRTTLLIAHRPTTLRYCDLALVMEKGRVAEVTRDVPTIVRRMLEPEGRRSRNGQ